MRTLALALCLALALAAVALGSTATVTTARPADLTPTPEPTAAWDGSDLSVSGFCDHGTPTFSITNLGADMQGPAVYRFTNSQVTAAVCTNEDNNEDGAGVVQLGAGASITLTWPDEVSEPPYSLCVLQRPGHPGVTWVATTISPNPQCVTAEQPVSEPGGGGRVFIPNVRR